MTCVPVLLDQNGASAIRSTANDMRDTHIAGMKPMRQSLIFTFLFALCVGCGDTHVRQQQAEEARNKRIENELRELGQKMHNDPASELATSSAKTDTSEDSSDSSPQSADAPK